jgi:predicted amidohydrolase YtcJ
MSFEYRGMPGYRGELNYDPVLFREIVSRAQEQGVQVAVHTNGDRAMDMVLDAMERAAELFPRPWLRHKLLHCYVADGAAARMAALGVVADVQPVFVSDETTRVEGVPERCCPSLRVEVIREAGIIVAASPTARCCPQPCVG